MVFREQATVSTPTGAVMYLAVPFFASGMPLTEPYKSRQASLILSHEYLCQQVITAFDRSNVLSLATSSVSLCKLAKRPDHMCSHLVA